MRRHATFAQLGSGAASDRVRRLVRADALAGARIEGVLRFGRPAALVDALFVAGEEYIAVALLVPTPRAAFREAPPLVWPDRIAAALDDATAEAIDAALAPWVFAQCAGVAIAPEASAAFTSAGRRLLARARGLGLPGAAPLDRVARALQQAAVLAPFVAGKTIVLGHTDARAAFGMLAAAGARIRLRENDDDDAFAARWFGIEPATAPARLATRDADDAIAVEGDVPDLAIVAHDALLGLATASGTRPPRRVVFGSGAASTSASGARGTSAGAIALGVRDDALRARDADTAAAEALAARLRDEGLTATLVPFAELGGAAYDLLHLIGSEPPAHALAALRRARGEGKPVVLTPLPTRDCDDAAWGTRLAVQAVAHRADEAGTEPLLAALAARRLETDDSPAAHAVRTRAAADRAALLAEADAVCDAPTFVEPGAPSGAAFAAVAVAAIEPRANLIAVARACARAGIVLVLAGPIVDAAYFAFVAAFGGASIAYLGDLAEADVARTVASARAYVDVAWHPRGSARIAAALAAGVAVVTAGRNDDPTLAGEGVFTVDAAAPDALAAALHAACALDAAARERVAGRFRERAEPGAATAAVLGLYASLADRVLN